MMRDALKAHLKREEDWKPYAYRDSEGYLTIGYGHLIDERRGGAIPREIGEALLDWKLDQVEAALDREFPSWRGLSESAQRAVAAMAYQLGVGGLKGFAKMWAALGRHDYVTAQHEALDSKWARQTPARALRVAAMLKE